VVACGLFVGVRLVIGGVGNGEFGGGCGGFRVSFGLDDQALYDLKAFAYVFFEEGVLVVCVHNVCAYVVDLSLYFVQEQIVRKRLLRKRKQRGFVSRVKPFGKRVRRANAVNSR